MASDLFFDVSAALSTWDDTPALTYFEGKWSDKHWMNTPGPLYCSDTDNCGTGPIEAPNNVQVDSVDIRWFSVNLSIAMNCGRRSSTIPSTDMAEMAMRTGHILPSKSGGLMYDQDLSGRSCASANHVYIGALRKTV